MYACERAIVRHNGVNQRFVETQVNDIPVRDLLADNETVKLILTHTAADHELCLDLKDVQTQVYTLDPAMTVAQWLQANGNRTLPTSDQLPKIVTKQARYRDLFVAGYHAEKIHPLAGDGNMMPDADLTDLRITKLDADYKDFFEHALVTINGFPHLTDYSSRGIQVKDAGRSIRYANLNNIGLISFANVGKVTCYPITDEMIHPMGDTAQGQLPLKNGVILSVPDVDLTDKVVMLSLGGWLHHSNSRYTVLGQHSILLAWPQLPIMEMFYDARPFIDMSKFEETLSPQFNKREALDLNVANKDESIRAYLKLSQSFIITIEVDNFYTDRIKLENTQLAGRYYHHEYPRLPLQFQDGRMLEYMTYHEDGVHVLAVNENLAKRYLHNTRPYAKEDHYVTGGKISSFPTYYGSAYLLDMGTEYLE